MVGGSGKTTPGTSGHVGERAERRSSGHACPTSDNHIECSPNSEALPGNAGAGSRLALEGSVAPDAQELEQTGSVRVDPRWAIVTGQMTAEMGSQGMGQAGARLQEKRSLDSCPTDLFPDRRVVLRYESRNVGSGLEGGSRLPSPEGPFGGPERCLEAGGRQEARRSPASVFVSDGTGTKNLADSTDVSDLIDAHAGGKWRGWEDMGFWFDDALRSTECPANLSGQTASGPAAEAPEAVSVDGGSMYQLSSDGLVQWQQSADEKDLGPAGAEVLMNQRSGPVYPSFADPSLVVAISQEFKKEQQNGKLQAQYEMSSSEAGCSPGEHVQVLRDDLRRKHDHTYGVTTPTV